MLHKKQCERMTSHSHSSCAWAGTLKEIYLGNKSKFKELLKK